VSSNDIDRQAGVIPCYGCGHWLCDHEELDTGDPPGRTVNVCHGGENCHCSQPDEYGPEPDDYAYDTWAEYNDRLS